MFVFHKYTLNRIALYVLPPAMLADDGMGAETPDGSLGGDAVRSPVSTLELHKLFGSVPIVLVKLIALISTTLVHDVSDVDYVEAFAGSCCISNGFDFFGYEGVPFDILLEEDLF